MARPASDKIPPYVSYRTLTNLLAEFQAQGIPSRIDRSLMAHKSGTVQSQLLLALKYLGLMKGSGHPTERLRTLVDTEGSRRKALLERILRDSYDFVFSSGFDLETATSNQAEELFQSTGASGETVRRSIGFFLAAAREAGIPCSPYIKPHRKTKSSTRKKTLSEEEATPTVDPTHPLSKDENESKRLQLRSGGRVALELSLNVFELDKTDREFVFRLIDLLNDYPKSQGE